MKSTDNANITQENNMNTSNRICSEHDPMLKTMNSFGSFYQNEHSTQQSHYSNKRLIEKLRSNRILRHPEWNSTDPIHSSGTIRLEKKVSNSSKNNIRVGQKSIPIQRILTRESMNLTPQLQSPDTNLWAKIANPSKKWTEGAFSRNENSSFIKSKMLSSSFLKRDKSISSIVPHSSVKISQTYLKSKDCLYILKNYRKQLK